MNAREDYELFLKENGLTQAAMDESLSRVVMDGAECSNVFVDRSDIAGTGIFAVSPIGTGIRIDPIKIGGNWTLAGRYGNHSNVPNAFALKEHDNFVLISRKPIAQGEEITADYRQVKQAMEGA